MIKRIAIAFIISYLGNIAIIYGQNICGTTATISQVNLENTFTITQDSANHSIPQLNRTLTISIFVIKDSNGQPDVTTNEINTAVTSLNQYFSPITLSFKIDNITYINNYQLDTIFMGQNELQLEKSYFEKNVINLYLVAGLFDQSQNDVCGYTYMPPSQNGSIFIKKSCFLGSTTLAHQIGHFFNLYHTHDTIFGSELVARPGNCATAGDRCCDTDADPNLEGLVNTNCIYTGTAKDANKSFYMPSTKNLMSFSNDNCRCFLSHTQYMRIIYALNHFRSYLR
jgi:hypothetical protein